MIDHLYYLQIDLAALRVALTRPHDEARPIGSQITDDDYRQAIRDYFDEVGPLDEPTVETALLDIHRHQEEQVAINAMCDSLIGVLLSRVSLV